MTGAGISTSAGIPDLQTVTQTHAKDYAKYKLPFPDAIFHAEYFKKTPQPFYDLAKRYLDLDNFQATAAHHFIKMLHEKNMVSYHLTENIDFLESKTGLKRKDIIFANGGNFGATCASCR